MTRFVYCIKLNQKSQGLDYPPFPNALGQYLYEHVSKEAWQGWLRHQTMLINENRLNLAESKARDYLTNALSAYFGLDQPTQ